MDSTVFELVRGAHAHEVTEITEMSDERSLRRIWGAGQQIILKTIPEAGVHFYFGYKMTDTNTRYHHRASFYQHPLQMYSPRLPSSRA